MPPNTVSVTRPGRWGNPFKPGEPLSPQTIEEAVAAYRAELTRGNLSYTIEDVKRELRGKNLACFCPEESPCHGDVLLEIANES